MQVRASASAPLGLALGAFLAFLPAGCGRSTEVPADAAELDPAATASVPLPTETPASSASPAHRSAPEPSKGPGAPAPSASAAAREEARPLAVWMRGPATASFNSGDLEAIAISFERMIPWAPSGYANWASIAKDGADAARAGSMEGVKAACRGCHAQYRAPYMATFATRPLP